MAKRLIKVAKELNVGTSTIVDFLKANEFEIENKPTAKISDQMELMLQKEFQKSIAIKEKANQIKIGRTPPKKEAEAIVAKTSAPTVPTAPEVTEPVLPKPTINLKETTPAVKLDKPIITAENNTPKLSKLNVLGTIDLSPKAKKEAPAPTPPAPKPVVAKKKEEIAPPKVEAAPKKETPTPAPVAPVTPVAKKEVKKEEAVKPKAINIKPEKKASPPKVEAAPKKETSTPTPVAKKEVKKEEAVKPKAVNPKPEKKARPPKVEATPKKEAPTPAPAAPATPTAKKEVKSEAVSDTTPPTATKSEAGDDMVQHKAPELRGLKIKGKIDINKLSRPKKKTDPKKAGEEKKKRKRTRRKVSADGRRVEGGDNRGGQRTGGGSGPRTGGGDNRGGQRTSSGGGPRTGGGGPRTGGGGPRTGGGGPRTGGGGPRTGGGGPRTGGGGPRTGGGGPRTGGGGPRRGPGGRDNRGRRDDRRGDSRGRRDEPKEVSAKEIEDKIKATMARISGGGKKKRQKLRRESRERQRERQEVLEQEKETGNLQVTEFISVSELASVMDVGVSEVIMTCMNMGVIVSINQRLDAEVIELVATEFNHEVEFISVEEQVDDEVEEVIDDPADLKPRSPIVTVMGHVDHGKTSLLDYIRNAKVADGEAGGITQHIGAYEVEVNGQSITFLDTPGHEAFTAMRARGAKVTDIAIIIVAADDNVMPQTKEAISHAQAAGVPIVFAINKIDKDGANPDRIKTELAGMNLQVEEWGGKYQSQDISAKMGTGIDELLEKVILEAEMLELKANPDKKSVGAILEASLDKGRGYVTKSLIQAGTLRIGDPIVAGEYSGKVKAMFNEHGKRIKEAGPSKPVLILGLNGAPQAGERFKEMDTETEARQVATKRERINREQVNRATKRISLDEIGRRLALGSFKELNLIVKGDVDGSIEALSDSLIKLSIESVQVNVIHKAVGQIIESDVLLASASDAIIIGFQVRPSLGARKLAEKEGVEVKMYSIIYEAIEEIKLAIEGLLEPTKEEVITANVEIRETYKISKVGTIAGCYVQDGKITRASHVRIVRNGIVVYPTRENVVGKIASLKRFKDDVKEAKTGMECGLNIENFNDIKVGDVIEAYEIKEVKQKLS